MRGLGYVPSLRRTVPPDDVLRDLCEIEKVERRGERPGGLGVVLSLSSKSLFFFLQTAVPVPVPAGLTHVRGSGSNT